MELTLCRDHIMLLSFFACIGGLILLLGSDRKSAANDVEPAEQMLMMMTFAYWLVHCIVFAVQKLHLPEWDVLLLSLKLTSIISYLLTFACTLSLPLNRLAVRQVEE